MGWYFHGNSDEDKNGHKHPNGNNIYCTVCGDPMHPSLFYQKVFEKYLERTDGVKAGINKVKKLCIKRDKIEVGDRNKIYLSANSKVCLYSILPNSIKPKLFYI